MDFLSRECMKKYSFAGTWRVLARRAAASAGGYWRRLSGAVSGCFGGRRGGGSGALGVRARAHAEPVAQLARGGLEAELLDERVAVGDELGLVQRTHLAPPPCQVGLDPLEDGGEHLDVDARAQGRGSLMRNRRATGCALGTLLARGRGQIARHDPGPRHAEELGIKPCRSHGQAARAVLVAAVSAFREVVRLGERGGCREAGTAARLAEPAVRMLRHRYKL